MKVAHADTHVKASSGLAEKKNFSIRTNAHAFKMLSSGLYSDKVRAVLREIGCNAFDAHVEAGTPNRPIEVKIPNRIDKQFYVKDWGPGLSHDAVMNLYTEYFNSTKQTSNDFTGAFGLGSKSPFSYVDSFVVTSAFQGKKRTYSLHLGDDGAPTIGLLATEDADSDWPHGLMVSFPVKAEDTVEFQQKAQQVFRWFRVPPKMQGMADIKPVEFAFDSPEFVRLKEGSEHGVVMGNVIYPLSVSDLPGIDSATQWMFQFPGIVIRAAIGDVQVAASRESLDFDKATVAFLLNRCKVVTQFIADDIATTLRAFDKAKWSVKCATAGIETKWRSTDRWFNWADFFKAYGMKDAASLAETLKSRQVDIPKKCGVKTAFRVLEAGYKGVKHQVVREGLCPKDKWGNQAGAALDLEPLTKIYAGKAPHALARARSLVVAGTYKQVVLVVPDSKLGGTEADAKAEAKVLADAYPGLEVEDIANVPIPPGFAAKGTGKARKKKGAQLPPLPSKQVSFLPVDSDHTKKVDIAVQAPHFMCLVRGWAYRVFDKTVEDDVIFEARDWLHRLREVHVLQKETGLKLLDGHVLVTAAEVREMDLVKRGWRTTHAVIREWIDSKAVRDEVAAIASKWRPTIGMNYGSGWLYGFCSLRHKYPALYNQHVAPQLSPAFATGIADICDASVKAGANAGLKTPKAVTAHMSLQTLFDVPAQAAPASAKRTYIDPQDLERQLLAAYPLLAQFEIGHMTWLAQNQPLKLAEFVSMLVK